MENNLNIVNILGVGLSGFGFLLMYLAYRLINRVIGSIPPQELIIKIIYRYMLVCFAMTISVGVFTFINALFKNNIISTQAKDINKKNDALNVLASSYKNDMIVDSIINYKYNDTMSFLALREQEKVLDTLSNYISKSNDTAVYSEFNKYKDLINGISDSLTMKKFNKTEIDLLKSSYLKYNKSINEISLNYVNEVSPDLKINNPTNE